MLGIASHGIRRVGRQSAIILFAGSVGLLGILVTDCGYDHTRGNPVDQWHYDHTIFVRKDFSAVSIQTYINRTQWNVGLQREDLYDGNLDGILETPGMDRVVITEYTNVEDPPETAVLRTGELRDYNDVFKEIIGAAKAGEKGFTIGERQYDFHFVSQDADMATGRPLG
ncbi:MAG: hypothetical protein V1774_02670 [Candidatus Eisenbacteria bacterium]